MFRDDQARDLAEQLPLLTSLHMAAAISAAPISGFLLSSSFQELKLFQLLGSTVIQLCRI